MGARHHERQESPQAAVFMRDRVTDRVRSLSHPHSRFGRWCRRPVAMGHLALLALLGLAAANLLALAPLG